MHISYHYVLPESYNYEIADYVTKLFLLSLSAGANKSRMSCMIIWDSWNYSYAWLSLLCKGNW